MAKKVGKFINFFLDLIFPKQCLGCGVESVYLCQNCFEAISVSKSIKCFFCGRRSPAGYVCQKCRQKNHPALAGLLVASDWQNILLRQVIYEYKYRFVRELAEPLGKIMIDFLVQNHLITKIAPDGSGQQTHQPKNWPTNQLILLPVPLHKRRLTWRGFNQAQFIAKQLANKLRITLQDDLLLRPRHTSPQMEIKDKKARVENIADAFTVNPAFDAKRNNPIKNKIVLLIDDICTTGATLEECARALKALRPKEIWGLVLARG